MQKREPTTPPAGATIGRPRSPVLYICHCPAKRCADYGKLFYESEKPFVCLMYFR